MWVTKTLNLVTKGLATTLLALIPPSISSLALSDQESFQPDTLFVLHSYKNVLLKCTLELIKWIKSLRCYWLSFVSNSLQSFAILVPGRQSKILSSTVDEIWSALTIKAIQKVVALNVAHVHVRVRVRDGDGFLLWRRTQMKNSRNELALKVGQAILFVFIFEGSRFQTAVNF